MSFVIEYPNENPGDKTQFSRGRNTRPPLFKRGKGDIPEGGDRLGDKQEPERSSGG